MLHIFGQTNLARWEPRHGKFRYRHPWKQYLEIGRLNRECAYRLEVLNGYLKTNQFQVRFDENFGPRLLDLNSTYFKNKVCNRSITNFNFTHDISFQLR